MAASSTSPGAAGAPATRSSGRWHEARAALAGYDEAILRRVNAYARSGPRTLGIDPVVVRVQLLS